jgi:hypothetical protein
MRQDSNVKMVVATNMAVAGTKRRDQYFVDTRTVDKVFGLAVVLGAAPVHIAAVAVSVNAAAVVAPVHVAYNMHRVTCTAVADKSLEAAADGNTLERFPEIEGPLMSWTVD